MIKVIVKDHGKDLKRGGEDEDEVMRIVEKRANTDGWGLGDDCGCVMGDYHLLFSLKVSDFSFAFSQLLHLLSGWAGHHKF